MGHLARRIVYVVNVDWFFISHRLSLALEAIHRNWEVYLISKNTGRFTELEDLGIKCIPADIDRSGRNPLKELGLILFLRNKYKEIDPEIIHHITLKPSIYGTIAARSCRAKAKIINAVSGLGYNFTRNRRSLSRFFIIKLLKYAFSDKKAYFIFQNPDDRAFYNSLKLLNDHNSVIIKGSGVDENAFPEKKGTVYQGKVRIVFLSRMLKDKGVFEFVRAANELRDRYADRLEFILAGGTDLHSPAFITEETLNELTDGKYLIWRGYQEDVRGIYENADIVCLPSYREGLPKSLVEAMACGCPIITTDAIGCRECVDDGINGFLVPVGDHKILAQRIETLVLDRELRIKMGHKSREKMVNEMAMSIIIKMTFDLYDIKPLLD